MTRFLVIPFYSFFLMMIYAALIGKERLLKYSVGDPLNLFEEWLIIMGIAFVITTIRTIYERVTNRGTD